MVPRQPQVELQAEVRGQMFFMEIIERSLQGSQKSG